MILKNCKLVCLLSMLSIMQASGVGSKQPLKKRKLETVDSEPQPFKNPYLPDCSVIREPSSRSMPSISDVPDDSSQTAADHSATGKERLSHPSSELVSTSRLTIESNKRKKTDDNSENLNSSEMDGFSSETLDSPYWNLIIDESMDVDSQSEVSEGSQQATNQPVSSMPPDSQQTGSKSQGDQQVSILGQLLAGQPGKRPVGGSQQVSVISQPISNPPLDSQKIIGRSICHRLSGNRSVINRQVNSRPPVGNQQVSGHPANSQPLVRPPVVSQPPGNNRPVIHQQIIIRPPRNQQVMNQPLAHQQVTNHPVNNQPLGHPPISNHPLAHQPAAINNEEPRTYRIKYEVALGEYLKRLDNKKNLEKIIDLAYKLSNMQQRFQMLYDIAYKYDLKFVMSTLLYIVDSVPPFEYTNGTFLYILFTYELPGLTADVIKTRFKTGFLSQLSTSQITRLVVTLLQPKITIPDRDRLEILEMVFGHIDSSAEMKFEPQQVSTLVSATLSSALPPCFELVFLTPKLYRVFQPAEQEALIKQCFGAHSDGHHYLRGHLKRETLIMLYLFLYNRSEANSDCFRNLKDHIIRKFGKGQFSNYGIALGDAFANPEYRRVHLTRIVATLDTCLLCIPQALRALNGTAWSGFKDDLTRCLFTNEMYTPELPCSRFASHVGYAVSKFGDGCGASTAQNALYFNPRQLVQHFQALGLYVCKEATTNIPQGHFPLAVIQEMAHRNLFKAFRMITQHKEYQSDLFVLLSDLITDKTEHSQTFTTILLIMMGEEALKEFSETPFWKSCEEGAASMAFSRAISPLPIANLFMKKASIQSDQSVLNSFDFCGYTTWLYNVLSCLLLGYISHRDRYLCQRIFFNPDFRLFKVQKESELADILMLPNLLNNAMERKQFVRDLLLDDHYYALKEKDAKYILMMENNADGVRIDVERENSKEYIHRSREKRIINSVLLR